MPLPAQLWGFVDPQSYPYSKLLGIYHVADSERKHFDAEVLGWLIAASDSLTAAAFDLAPGGTRHTLIKGIAAIERRDMQATNLVTPAVVGRMHRHLTSLLIAHIRYFADEAQLSVL